MDDTTKTKLREALSRVQPKYLDSSIWGRLQGPTLDLLLATEPRDLAMARRRLSHVMAFLTDVAPLRPGAELATLLTMAEVSGFLHRRREA